MTLPYRETTLRGLLRVVYPNARGVQVVDQFTLLRLVHVGSLDGAISANLSTKATYRGKAATKTTINGNLSTEPRRP